MKKGLKKFSFNAKVLVALAAICTLFVFETKAQDAAKPEKKTSFILGVRTGVNANKLLVSHTGSSEWYSGAQGTIFGLFNFNNWVGVSLEAGVSQSGGAGVRYESSNPSYGKGTIDFRLTNIQANLLSHFKLPVLSVYEPRLILGPSFDFNTFASGNTEGMVGQSGVKYSYDATQAFQPVDVGAIVGLGVDFDLKFAKLFVDARYRHGLFDVNQLQGTTNARAVSSAMQNYDVRTRGISVQVGLGFKLGK